MIEISEERELFRQALLEARLRKSQQMIDAESDEIVFSARHLHRIDCILKSVDAPFRPTSSTRQKKRILALLIAAAILLFGSITVYANRDTIARFVQKIFGDHTEVSYSDHDNNITVPEGIEQEYTLTYVPDGYELAQSISDYTLVWKEWINAEGKYLQFKQRPINESLYIFDNDNSITECIQVGDFEIYCTHFQSNDSAYLWTDGQYVYEIECCSDISIDELTRMINSISTSN